MKLVFISLIPSLFNNLLDFIRHTIGDYVFKMTSTVDSCSCIIVYSISITNLNSSKKLLLDLAFAKTGCILNTSDLNCKLESQQGIVISFTLCMYY